MKLTDDEFDHFEERVAILIFDAGYTEEDAKKFALEEILKRREDGIRT